jgi:mannose-1-phosphate guanylyltransferase
MSRQASPKQLIPFISGKSLLQLAWERVDGIVPPERCFICAGERHRQAIFAALPGLSPDTFLGEPEGRDTVNALGLSAAVIAQRDPDAAIAVFTADHIIQPLDRFRAVVQSGFEVVEKSANTLVTFGIEPAFASTGYGYLELGAELEGGVRAVDRFKEKPDQETAQSYYTAGPSRYLWNSGMFVWRASTLLDCIRRFEPTTRELLVRIAEAWDSGTRDQVLSEVYPKLKKISVDYAVMEPASRDPLFRVAALPMPLEWLDVGSWLTFAKTCPPDGQGNALSAERTLLEQTSETLVVSSDPKHLIAAVGCQDLIIVHTPDATLVCRKDQAEAIKALQQQIGVKFEGEYL